MFVLLWSLSMNRWALKPAEASKCQSSLPHPLTSLICVLHTHSYTKHIQNQSSLKAVAKLRSVKSEQTPNCIFSSLDSSIYLLVRCCLFPSRSYLCLTHTFNIGVKHLASLCGVLLAKSRYLSFSHPVIREKKKLGTN